MRSIQIDELTTEDIRKLQEYLNMFAEASSVDDLYWVDLTPDVLDVDQYENKEDQPFCFAVEVGDAWARFELLIRSRKNIGSLHARYANRQQQRFILDFANRLIDDLSLMT